MIVITLLVVNSLPSTVAVTLLEISDRKIKPD